MLPACSGLKLSYRRICCWLLTTEVNAIVLYGDSSQARSLATGCASASDSAAALAMRAMAGKDSQMRCPAELSQVPAGANRMEPPAAKLAHAVQRALVFALSVRQ